MGENGGRGNAEHRKASTVVGRKVKKKKEVSVGRCKKEKKKEGSQWRKRDGVMLSAAVPNMLSQDVCIRAQRRTWNDTACYVPPNERDIFRSSAPYLTAQLAQEKGKENVLITFNERWGRAQTRRLLQYLKRQPRLIDRKWKQGTFCLTNPTWYQIMISRIFATCQHRHLWTFMKHDPNVFNIKVKKKKA